jgi:hypothetical protein
MPLGKCCCEAWQHTSWVFFAVFILIVPVVLFSNYNPGLFAKWYIIAMPVFVVIWFASYTSFVILYAIVFLIMYILTIYFLIVLFKFCEFFALKLPEYDKGPLLAAAAALTALGSLLKAFGK